MPASLTAQRSWLPVVTGRGMFMAALRVLLLGFIVSFTSSSFGAASNEERKTDPVALKGLLDLTEWDFEKDGAIDLNGEWQFFWNRHVDNRLLMLGQLTESSSEYIEVPGNWNDHSDYSNLGFATYRLEVLVSEPKALALKVRTVGTSYRMIVDGVLLNEVGMVGQSRMSSSPQYQTGILPFSPDSKRIEIIIQVSNFHHRNAGLWESVKIGLPEQVYHERQNRVSIDLFLFGAIVMMAFYNLFTWLTRRENTSGFWLGLFCLVLSTRILFIDERYIEELLENLSWSVSTRFEYFSWFVSIPIFLAFIRSMFPTEASLLVLRCLWVTGGVFSILVVFLPIVYATQLVPAYQMLTLLALAYGSYCIALAIWRRKDGSLLFGLSALCLFLSAASDIATLVFTLDADNQLQFGLFLFVLLQSIQVSVRSSRAFQTVEAQSSELRKTNLELHIQEKLRRAAEGKTQALNKQMNHSERALGYAVMAEAMIEREEHIHYEPTATQVPSISSNGPNRQDYSRSKTHMLRDLVKIIRGSEPEHEALNLTEELHHYFASDDYRDLKSAYPLIEVSLRIADATGDFFGSRPQIELLIHHLLKYCLATQNQAQHLQIQSRSEDVFAASLFHHQVNDGRYFILAVEDQGYGFRPEDLVEIFDPEQRSSGYASLKKPLMDLAVVWTILEEHGGAVDVHSLAESTKLEFYFPMSISTT